jgi:hypothetical protein
VDAGLTCQHRVPDDALLHRRWRKLCRIVLSRNIEHLDVLNQPVPTGQILLYPRLLQERRAVG